MLKHDKLTRDVVAGKLRHAIDVTVAQQLERGAQEPPITSKVAASIETLLDGEDINGYLVSAVAQDFTDRGSRSGEKRSGADLYIGIRVEDSLFGLPPITKGVLIQAKKYKPLVKTVRARERATLEQMKLVDQCERMLERTNAASAFVWLYHPNGTRVVPASEVVAHYPLPTESLTDRGVEDQFRDILDCFQGDPNLWAPDIFASHAALGGFMEDVAADRAIAITLTPPIPD